MPISYRAATQCNGSFGEFFHLSAAKYLRSLINAGNNFDAVAIYVDRPNGMDEDDPRIHEAFHKMRLRRLTNDLFLLIRANPNNQANTATGLAYYQYTFVPPLQLPLPPRPQARPHPFPNYQLISINAAVNLLAGAPFFGNAPFAGNFSLRNTAINTFRKLWKQSNATKTIAEAYNSPGVNKVAFQNEAIDKWTGPATLGQRLAITGYIDGVIPLAQKDTPKLIIWSREVRNDELRNMNFTSLSTLIGILDQDDVNIHPVLFGEILKDNHGANIPLPQVNNVTIHDFREHYNNANFSMNAHDNSYARQLFLLRKLYTDYNVLGIIGGKSGFIDGAGLMGIPVIALESRRDRKARDLVPPANISREGRMHKWVRPTIPNYFIFPTRNLYTPNIAAANTLVDEEKDPLLALFFLLQGMKLNQLDDAYYKGLLLKLKNYYASPLGVNDPLTESVALKNQFA